MLSATCDEFLKSMCDCIEIADNNFGQYTICRLGYYLTDTAEICIFAMRSPRF